MSEDDRSHFVLCDWNLYADQRPDPELCNLDCASQPEAVAENWKQADAGYPNLRRPEHSDGSS
jgi:hypothetical protein